jgi:hypothetical protein
MPISFGSRVLNPGVRAKGMKKGKGVKKTSHAVSGGMKLDLRRAGAAGKWVLEKNLKNPALNRAIDKIIKEADTMRALTLKQ